jgi:glycosyltransferase involved in cell wall biosynthesis
MKITFILPGSGHHPVGGFKIVYEYSNRLVARGHQVNIVQPALLEIDPMWFNRPVRWSLYIKRLIDKSFLPDSWFLLDHRVNLLWVPSLKSKYIPDCDVVVATAWETAEWVAKYPASKGVKYYLIQHLETWGGDESRVLNTWKLPLQKIVIARWLEKIADGMGENALYVPNGLDFESFNLDMMPESRDSKDVMMLFHEAIWKGVADGLEALVHVRKVIPDLRVTLFGVPAAHNLPKWVEYQRSPKQKDLRRLYNQAAIFISPSWTEGWGLTGSEAMMCGSALVATDIGGHQEYMRHEITAILSPPKQPELLANNILRLILDTDMRVSLAKAGNENIQKFTWKRATDRLEAILCKAGVNSSFFN